MLDSRLVEMLVCPLTKTSLVYRRDLDELWCRASRLAYPIRDDQPIMIESEARALTQDEVDQLR